MTMPLKARIGKALLTGALVCATSFAAHAQQKVGLVDLKKVFEGYYKTKQADAQLKERATDSEKVLKGMVDDYQKANEEYRKLADTLSDPSLANEEKEKRKKTAENKLMEIQEIEKSVQQFRRQTQTTLDEQKRRMRDNILGEIRTVITAKAKTGGFTFVFDTAAESINQTPFLLFSKGENDLTDEVLTQINLTAPAGSLSSDPAEKPTIPAAAAPQLAPEKSKPAVLPEKPTKKK